MNMNAFVRCNLVLALLFAPAFARAQHWAHEPIRFSVPETRQNQAPSRGTVPPPATGTRSAAERTGAIHYAPALDTDTAVAPDTARDWRFELGIRSMGVHLTEDKKGKPFHGSFIGSIYKLKAKQNWLPIHPFAQLEFALPGGLWLGAGATYSHLDVETLDDGGGDGDIESDLVLGYAVMEYPAERLRPYAEAGGGRAFNTFDAIGSWSSGGRREFVLEDSPVWMVGGGIGVAVTDRFTLDAHVRYVHFDVDGTYVFRGDKRPDTDFTFTPSYVAAGIGASYAL